MDTIYSVGAYFSLELDIRNDLNDIISPHEQTKG